MGIKAILNACGCGGPSYPKLMKSTVSSAVLLMRDNKIGTVIAGVSADGHTIGYQTENWNMSTLVDFEGQIILENK